ncbi:hypothetical protein ACWGB8_03110 [Kitasatospora sp. NPDC054939]
MRTHSTHSEHLPRPASSGAGDTGVPAPAPAVPPRHELPQFPPIRAGCTRRHRLRRTVRGPGMLLAAGLLLAGAALVAEPRQAGLPPPAAAPAHRTGCQSGDPGDHP